MDRDRLEAITAPKGEPAALLSEEESRLREAWLAFGGAIDASTGIPAPLDPDDIVADLLRRERRTQTRFRRNAVLGASMLAAALLIGASFRNLIVGPPAAVAIFNAPAWDDDWDAKASAVDADLVAVNETLRAADEAWIDRRIQQLFEECALAWATL